MKIYHGINDGRHFVEYWNEMPVTWVGDRADEDIAAANAWVKEHFPALDPWAQAISINPPHVLRARFHYDVSSAVQKEVAEDAAVLFAFFWGHERNDRHRIGSDAEPA